ncbi:MAG: hypothetical protein Q9225_001218 [Loekoesia sp. 1 TL-2023]
MRLLHTETLEFKEFFDTQIPQYAILSHRWGNSEVSFKEMRKGTAPDGPGMTKIQSFCRLAAGRGFSWAWIDTCCIDKRSSAELSEAINAMFKWYERSGECYVYLSDVEYSPYELLLKNRHEQSVWITAGWPMMRARFQQSSWFTRGWTLQELIAPEKSKVLFFDANWNQIGSLSELAKDVSDITGIEEFFMGFRQPWNSAEKIPGMNPSAKASVARIMSWASHRHTSREEDMAYCLLGLFNVHMPLLYGEGAEKAFFRLQVEIMSSRNDESLFAWTSNQRVSGMLATSPRYFAQSGDIESFSRNSRRPYFMTNKGLEIHVPRKHINQGDQKRGALLILQCRRATEYAPLVIQLQRDGSDGAYRTECGKLENVFRWSPAFEKYKGYNLSKDLKDSCVIHVCNPHEEYYQRGMLCNKILFEGLSQEIVEEYRRSLA